MSDAISSNQMSDYELMAACRAAIWMRFAAKQDMEESMWLALHDKLKERLERDQQAVSP